MPLGEHLRLRATKMCNQRWLAAGAGAIFWEAMMRM